MIKNIMLICLLIALILALFSVLLDKDEVVSFDSFLSSLEESPQISTEWVKAININVQLPDNKLLSGLITFINNFVLAPIRIILVLGTMLINAFVFIFNFVNIYFV